MAALISPGDDHYRLIVVDLGTQKFDTLAAPGDADIYNIRWLNDQRLIFGLSTEKMDGVGLFSTDAKNLNDCNALLQPCGASLVSVPRANRLRPLAWMSSDNNNDHIGSRYPLPKVGLSYGYLADKDGELAFAFTADKGVLALHRLADQAWEPCPVDLEKTDVFGSGNQPGEIAFSRSTEVGKALGAPADGCGDRPGGRGADPGQGLRFPRLAPPRSGDRRDRRRRVSAQRPGRRLVRRGLPRVAEDSGRILSRCDRAHPRQRRDAETFPRGDVFRPPAVHLLFGRPGASDGRFDQEFRALDRAGADAADERHDIQDARRPSARRLRHAAGGRVESRSSSRTARRTAWRRSPSRSA